MFGKCDTLYWQEKIQQIKWKAEPYAKKPLQLFVNFFFKMWYVGTGALGGLFADKGELNINEAKQIFSKMGIRLSLTIMYNL